MKHRAKDSRAILFLRRCTALTARPQLFVDVAVFNLLSKMGASSVIISPALASNGEEDDDGLAFPPPVEAVALGLSSAYSYNSPNDVPRMIRLVLPSVPRSLSHPIPELTPSAQRCHLHHHLHQQQRMMLTFRPKSNQVGFDPSELGPKPLNFCTLLEVECT